jgi:ribosomal protein L11 methyltransferase
VSLLGVSTIPDENWNSSWQQYFGPQYIGKNVLVLPPWITLPEIDKKRIVITINPGMAFGTGIHPTTKICLELLEKYIQPHTVCSILDVGCGSGILSIASRKLGAERVLGIDISTSALEASWQNIAYNDVDKIIISGESIEKISETFDIVVSNMLLGEIIGIKDEFKKKVKSGGYLILSGILNEQENEIRACILPDFRLVRKKQEGEWRGFVFKKRTYAPSHWCDKASAIVP